MERETILGKGSSSDDVIKRISESTNLGNPAKLLRTVNVVIDLDRYTDLALKVYNSITYDDGHLSSMLSGEEFVEVLTWALYKRVSWVRTEATFEQSIPVRLDPRRVPVPQPIFLVLAAIGVVEAMGLQFLPKLEGDFPLTGSQPDTSLLERYIQFVAKARLIYLFSESMPSDSKGTRAMLLHTANYGPKIEVVGPVGDATSHEATLAGVLRVFSNVDTLGALLTDLYSYGIIHDPDVLLEIFVQGSFRSPSFVTRG